MNKLCKSVAKRLFRKRDLDSAKKDLRRIAKHCTDSFTAYGASIAWRGSGYFESLDLKQSSPEFLELLDTLEKSNVSSVIEIGSHKGGSLFVWAQLIKSESAAFLCSIDLPGGDFGGGLKGGNDALFEAFCADGQDLLVLRGDSHSPEVLRQLDEYLGAEKKVDFLFIDGDHTYQGVRQDFLMYKRFVNTGGFVAFHDIIQRDDYPSIEVWKFWDELKLDPSNEIQEFVNTNPRHRTIGIGLLRV
jgi:cephalosporin hydroxylase